MAEKCPCNSDKSYTTCCEPYILGKKEAPTAEATMRARYTSFVKNTIDYLGKTFNPEEINEFNAQEADQWSKNSKWLGLEIISTKAGTENDTKGSVEFKAHYEAGGVKNTHHEVAQFQKIDDKWFFMDGKIVREQVVRSEPKIGRNDPCFCGSGKKFKKCCLLK